MCEASAAELPWTRTGVGAPALLAYCKAMTDLRTFARLRPGLAARGWTLVFVTHLLSVWMVARRIGIPCKLLRPTSDDEGPPWLSADGCPEILDGRTTHSLARRFQNSLWNSLEQTCREHNVGALCQWSGFLLCSRTTASFARAHRLPILFFETGNPERKLFADPEGVNGAARLADHPELLDACSVSELAAEAWRLRFLERRRGRVASPQSRAARRINAWFPLDRLGHRVLGVPQPERYSIRQKFKVKVRPWLAPTVEPVVPREPYVFLALQVKSDDVVKFPNSEAHDNVSSLEFAAARAATRKCRLVVKPHPAESDTRMLKRVVAFCRDGGHLLTSADSTTLVENAVEVITINSSVGLEAILLDRPVIFLGKSLYGRFSRRQAYAFVLNYLVNFPIDGSEPASAEAVDRILAMIEAERKPSASTVNLVPAQ
jgi:capsular polysaccharide export protein